MRFFKQTQRFSCGPACARMMLHELGFEATEEELIAALGAAAGKGTPMDNWFRLTEYYDVEVTAAQPGDIETLDRLIADGWKLTVLILTDVPHYVSYLGSRDGRVYMHDPWGTPNYSLLLRNFYRKWIITGETWRHDSIYISNRWYVALRRKN